MGKPLPYPYKVAPKYKDDKPYSWWEYGSEKFAPIPLEDAIQTVRQTMKDKGMSKTGIEQLLGGLEVIAVASTGARVSEYKEWNKNSK